MWQAFLDGLIYSLIGVAIVFFALIIIMFGVKLLNLIVQKIENKGNVETRSASTPVSKPAVAEKQPSSDEIAPEIVAAITAAISIIMSDPKCGASPLGFKVKKIKRI